MPISCEIYDFNRHMCKVLLDEEQTLLDLMGGIEKQTGINIFEIQLSIDKKLLSYNYTLNQLCSNKQEKTHTLLQVELIKRNPEKAQALKNIAQGRFSLSNASRILKEDLDVVMAAVIKNNYELQYASPELQNHPEVKKFTSPVKCRRLPSIRTYRLTINLIIKYQQEQIEKAVAKPSESRPTMLFSSGSRESLNISNSGSEEDDMRMLRSLTP